jgi:hypothetical protein
VTQVVQRFNVPLEGECVEHGDVEMAENSEYNGLQKRSKKNELQAQNHG